MRHSLKLILLSICIATCLVGSIGCGNNKKEASFAKEEDIKIENKCENLTPEKANKIADEVKELIVNAQKGVYKIENFSVRFSNERRDNEKTFADITVYSDWTTIRKPEDDPFVIAMVEARDKLKTEEEKQKADNVIANITLYMKQECTYEKDRTPDYFEVRFKNKDDLEYELFYPVHSENRIKYYPLQEYYNENYNENYKDNYQKRMEDGRGTLFEWMKYVD